ncbi:DUF1801 domain-containing protein [Rhodovulum sp. DZ06]|uniref:DUF1801 domain-containing protein n=1 Tax=Rhodovulum sp. DZ06 TaxID=3425126 RepID=UPI003D353425
MAAAAERQEAGAGAGIAPPFAAPPFASPAVAAAFDAFPAPQRALLPALRAEVFAGAAADPRIGPLEETLKWGQPSWRPRSGAGTALRVGLPKTSPLGPAACALYVHCQTSVIEDVRPLLPPGLHIEGTRAVHLCAAAPPPPGALRPLILRALTYKLRGA